MPEEVIFETETRADRGDVAALLRDAAGRLDADGQLTLAADGESLTLSVPSTVTFEVKAERETGSGPDELSVEFELEWDEGADDRGTDEGLSIG